MSDIQHSASRQAKIDYGTEQIKSLEAAGFKVIGFHMAGDRPTFTVEALPYPEQPKDYAEGPR